MVKYLDIGKLLERKEEARKIKRKAARFMLIDGLSTKGALRPPYCGASLHRRHNMSWLYMREYMESIWAGRP